VTAGTVAWFDAERGVGPALVENTGAERPDRAEHIPTAVHVP
jgi:hypothetical protein